MPVDLHSLTVEVYRQAQELGVYPPFATRLVKLIYLADLEWRRTHNGEPLSELSWFFHLYGPYAHEFDELLGEEDAEAVELVDGRTATRITFSEEELEKPRVPEAVSAAVRRIVKEWGDTNLNQLLNYVYFETEPMEGATRGQKLNFDDLIQPAKPVELRIDPKKLNELRVQLQKHVERLNLSREGLHSSALDFEGRRLWEEEDERPLFLPIGTTVTN